MTTIRVFHSTWNDETDKPDIGHADYPDAQIKIADDGVLLIMPTKIRYGAPLAAYNRWDHAIKLDPRVEEAELERAFDQHAADVERDYAEEDKPAEKLAEVASRSGRHIKWRASSAAS